jgi:hypothetical protein
MAGGPRAQPDTLIACALKEPELSLESAREQAKSGPHRDSKNPIKEDDHCEKRIKLLLSRKDRSLDPLHFPLPYE